ncbi:MAG: hypothetical protein AB1806_15305 [Acidobacteriota bacterium]
MTVNALHKRLWNLMFRARFKGKRAGSLVWRSVSRWEVLVRAVLFFGLASGLAAFINHATDADRVSGGTIAGVLIAMGSMFGGVLAIVFALSSFMQQNAAHLYSSQFYEVYARDRREKMIFGLIACLTISCFGLVLFQNVATVPLPQSVLVYLILLMTAAVFSLVDWQYQLVTRKINPLVALVFLEEQCLKSLARAHKFAKAIASWLRISDERLTEDQALAVSYARFITPQVGNVDHQLEHITEISLRLASKGELLATKRGLAAVHNVLAKYLEFRRDSSLALPAGPYLMAVESDSQNFLAKNFERTNTAGETLMAQRQSQSVVFIMDLYASLAVRSKEVQFLNRSGENPVLDQLRGYVRGLLDSAIRADDLEVCFRSVNVFKAIGMAAVDRRLHVATLYGVYGDLARVATWAITSKKPVFVEHCTDAIVTLVGSSIQEDVPGLEPQVAEALKQLQAITLAMQAAVSAGFIPMNVHSQFLVGKCYEQLEPVFATLAQRYINLPEGQQKSAFASNLLRLLDALYQSLREMSELLKNCDAPVVFNIASLIDEILKRLVHLSVDTKDIGKRQEFEKSLRWYTYLPGWFVEHASTFTSTHAFGTLAGVAPMTALLLLHRQAWPEHIVDCAKAAFSVTKQMLKKVKGGYAYDEPRHMLTICYLGIVALKQGPAGVGVVKNIIAMIREFEDLYRQKYFSRFTPPPGAYLGPRPEQLRIEMLRWRSDFIKDRYNFVPLSDDPDSIVRQLVDDADVDRFIVEAWETVPPHSSIEQELVERLGRRRGIRRLVAILTNELARRQSAGDVRSEAAQVQSVHAR